MARHMVLPRQTEDMLASSGERLRLKIAVELVICIAELTGAGGGSLGTKRWRPVPVEIQGSIA